MTLPYSDAIFVHAFPRECTEAFLEGHVRAFAFFGGVPRRIRWDYVGLCGWPHNPTSVPDLVMWP
jgi:transposase